MPSIKGAVRRKIVSRHQLSGRARGSRVLVLECKHAITVAPSDEARCSDRPICRVCTQEVAKAPAAVSRVAAKPDALLTRMAEQMAKLAARLEQLEDRATTPAKLNGVGSELAQS